MQCSFSSKGAEWLDSSSELPAVAATVAQCLPLGEVLSFCLTIGQGQVWKNPHQVCGSALAATMSESEPNWLNTLGLQHRRI